jgi:hypothetical protein
MGTMVYPTIIVTIILASVLIFIIITYKSGEMTLTDLYKVDASASVALLERVDGREPCLLSVGHEFMNISKALRDEIMYVRYWADATGMYNEYSSVTISGAEAYELVTTMIKGKAIIANKPHIEMLYKVMDKDGYISCIIEYDGRYYDLKVNPFGSMMIDDYSHIIPEDQGYVTVRVYYKELDPRFKIIALESNKHELFSPFNNLILLINELNSKVVISVSTDDRLIEDYHYAYIAVIPSKGSRLLVFPAWIASKYSYTVEPYNMQGKVVVRSYSPSCMSEEEVRHGYALAKFNLKLPLYMPEGYEYRCAIHIMNNYVMIYYSNSKDVSATGMQEAIAKGVLVMTAYRVLSHEDIDWDAIGVDNANREDVITMNLDGSKVVAYKEVDVDYDIWEKYYYNVLNLYDEEERVIYSFKSRFLNIDELADIARSLR